MNGSNHYRTILFFILFWIVSFSATGQELKPHHVIVKSSFREKSQLRPFYQHQYDLQSASRILEPYFPQFKVVHTQLPQDFSIDITLSGITKSFGELSELFYSDQGVLENAYLLYQQEDYQNSSRKLLSILPNSNMIIGNPWKQAGQFRQLMIMGGE